LHAVRDNVVARPTGDRMGSVAWYLKREWGK
jgi:hypothetical protein